MSRPKTDFKNIICSICEGELTSKDAYRERDKCYRHTGKWLCRKCYSIEDRSKRVGINHISDISNISLIQIEDVQIEKERQYNETNTCPKIRKDGNICGNKLTPGSVCRERDIYGNLTGIWVCILCHNIDREHNDPNSRLNIIKSLRDRRTGNLHNDNLIFADNCEELTKRWRGVKNLNKENDNYNSPIDHSRDPELGVVQTKGRRLNIKYQRWQAHWIEEHLKEFDNLILYCASQDGYIIERIYIFPWDEVIKSNGITIPKYPSESRGPYWYENYRVIDENILKEVNNIWRNIIGGSRP